MTIRHIPYLLTLVLCLGLQACGQRGPLYLPDEPQQDPQQDETARAR